jgi:hypothetical protein
MDLSTFYGLSSTSLADANKANGMRDAALAAWGHLSQYTLVFFGIMLLFSIGMAIYYYTEYNNQPNRHYTPQQWGLVGLASIIIVFVITLVFAYVMQKTGNIVGLFMLELKLAFFNALWAAGFYLVVSFVWCNLPFKTNAYRFLKL